MIEPDPVDPSERPSGLPYPLVPPTVRDDLPDRGFPGAPASWGMRALARIIDVVIVSFPFGFLVAALGTKTIAEGPDKGQLSGPAWPLLLFPICFILYETVLISMFGQTLGKWVCQVKAVQWSDGRLATLQEGFIRAFVPGVFLLVASAAALLGVPALGYLQFVPILIYLSSLANVIYRGPHDKAANTIVLAAPRSRRA
ncbi:MAG: RDD family protein [Microthrixaceae bacterium]